MTNKKYERIEKLIRKRKEEFAKRVKEMNRKEKERMDALTSDNCGCYIRIFWSKRICDLNYVKI